MDEHRSLAATSRVPRSLSQIGRQWWSQIRRGCSTDDGTGERDAARAELTMISFYDLAKYTTLAEEHIECWSRDTGLDALGEHYYGSGQPPKPDRTFPNSSSNKLPWHLQRQCKFYCYFTARCDRAFCLEHQYNAQACRNESGDSIPGPKSLRLSLVAAGGRLPHRERLRMCSVSQSQKRRIHQSAWIL